MAKQASDGSGDKKVDEVAQLLGNPDSGNKIAKEEEGEAAEEESAEEAGEEEDD